MSLPASFASAKGAGCFRFAVVATLVAGGVLACGASIRGTYESDVRFEHCMALDTRPDVKPTLRRACWGEWVSFYTFGQTRDRIDYARLRTKQLGAASDFDEGDHGPPVAAAAAPDPTSAIAPPPLVVAVTDAGVLPPSDGGTPGSTDTGGTARDRCNDECDKGLETCRKTCKATPPCEQACSARRKRCKGRCEAPRQGSR
jgi:hypothetical protein